MSSVEKIFDTALPRDPIPQYLKEYLNVYFVNNYRLQSKATAILYLPLSLMKTKDIKFPEPLLKALYKGQLVVFAGAGVSMGQPACLPDFRGLAKRIAQHTGQLQGKETEDLFLGHLHQERGVKVHDRAAQILARPGLAPTNLHRDLLRMFADLEKIRIVTTNFDCLFEQASEDELGAVPKVFQAPALPLGREFNGIVHVHGATSAPADMVLTGPDFGKAYLVDGWATRFLVEMFHHFVVLFVGYSHNEVIMSYLARALAVSEEGQRYALTDNGGPQLWQSLGITPIIYDPVDEHIKLYEGIHVLANLVQCSVTDWHCRITALAQQSPSNPSADPDLLREVFRNAMRIRFFTQSASLPVWINWLDCQGYLNRLFHTDPLDQSDSILAEWLADRFPFTHDDVLFHLFTKHDRQLHPYLWRQLGYRIGHDEEGRDSDKTLLARWVSLLLDTAPSGTDHKEILFYIGKRCAKQGITDGLLQVCDALVALILKPRFSVSLKKNDPISVNLLWNNDIHDYSLNNFWKNDLQPLLADIPEHLLHCVVKHIEGASLTLRTWHQENSLDNVTLIIRPNIAYTSQSSSSPPINVLIDIARDCLEYLLKHKPRETAAWCDLLAASDVVLLRRLAVHALYSRKDLETDEKISWILSYGNLLELAPLHEIFGAIGQAYRDASRESRVQVVKSLQAFDEQYNANLDQTDVVKYQFNSLYWLCRIDPDCSDANCALNELRQQYPDLDPGHAPGTPHWTYKVSTGFQSPWSVPELLKQPARDWLPKLLSFSFTDPTEPDRPGLVRHITQAAAQQFPWGIQLAEALAETEQWDSDLWPGLLRAWAQADLDEEQTDVALQWLHRKDLYSQHSRAIVAVLHSMMQSGHTSNSFFSQANEIAMSIWECREQIGPPKELTELWEQWQLNENVIAAQTQQCKGDVVGSLVDFWLQGLCVQSGLSSVNPIELGEDLCKVFSHMAQDCTTPGRLGGLERLARKLEYLLDVDEIWTNKVLMPLLHTQEDKEGRDALWSGLLYANCFASSVACRLQPEFLKAAPRISHELPNYHSHFIRHYTTMLVCSAEDPLGQWIPPLLSYGNTECKRMFAMEVGSRLDALDSEQQQEWWQRWLNQYWINRLQGVPVKLESCEIEQMLSWPLILTAVFAEATNLAIQMPVTNLLDGAILLQRFNFQSSDLFQKYPDEVIKLLSCLADTNPNGCEQHEMSPSTYYSWNNEGKKLIETLCQSGATSNFKVKLNELSLKAGWF